MAEGEVTIAPTNLLPTQETNHNIKTHTMKKAPTYTEILKAIAKVKTIKQLDKVQEQVLNYAGGPYKVTSLYKKYNSKNHKVRKPSKSK